MKYQVWSESSGQDTLYFRVRLDQDDEGNDETLFEVSNDPTDEDSWRALCGFVEGYLRIYSDADGIPGVLCGENGEVAAKKGYSTWVIPPSESE